MKSIWRVVSELPEQFLVCVVLVGMLHSPSVGAFESELRLFQPADIHRIKTVEDIALSRDGTWVAYSVTSTDTESDETYSNLFMARFDGTAKLQLTHGKKGGESHPRFSPDGRFLAFVTARGGDDDESDDPEFMDQVWRMNLSGGEAERLTSFPGGVSAFEWAPEGDRLVVVANDPEDKAADAEDKDKKKGKKSDTPKPIVVDRYQFKEDGVGFLARRYERLYLFDIARATHEQLTAAGDFHSTEPDWSPDGRSIVFTSKRGGDPDRHGNSDIYLIAAEAGASARRLSDWEGPDFSPRFSPDGKQVAYLQGGPPKYADYDPAQLALVSVSGGKPGFPLGNLDRHVESPRWSPNGKHIYVLLTDDRTIVVARVAAKGGKAERLSPSVATPGAAYEFAIGPRGPVALTTFPTAPKEIYRVSDGHALTSHNEALRSEIAWAGGERFDSVSEDGVSVGSVLWKPPGFRPGVAYPTIALVHGGPVAQDSLEFEMTSQILAAQGYLVVNPNYRGSNGRGREFSRAIYADWGNLEIKDIHAVMDKLVKDGLSDPKRLGIGGWSYGGMNTNYAIATDTRFSAAVSGAAISNALAGYGTDQYIRQYENEIGLPWESIDGYLRISHPFFNADKIKTPTLFMCGEKDFNVPLINSEQMYQALRTLNIPTELVIYPGQYHGLRTPSYRQDRLERMIAWYDRYLKTD